MLREKGLPYTVSSDVKRGGVVFSDDDIIIPNRNHKHNILRSFVEGFKRADVEELESDPRMTDQQKLAIMTANSPLLRSLKNRHLQMIAIGGAIGTGLFVGSGEALHDSGPAGLLIAYMLIGSMIFCTVQSMGELAVTFPIAGSFITFNSRFIDPSWGFAMAWSYLMQWTFVLPLEIMAAALTVLNWEGARHINPAIFVTIFLVLVACVNLFGIRGYGEAEFAFSIVKVLAVVGFIILSIVLVCGGGPVGGYIGGKYWHHPGAFANGVKGVCTVFVSAAFAFAGTELCGLAAAESANPRASLPKATKQVFWRITIFYVVSLAMVGLLVPYNDQRLLGASLVDVTASPFVIAIRNGGIKGLPSVMNVVVLVAVLSVANSSVFGSSRTLAAIAVSGQAPRIFGYIDKEGRPLVCIIVQLLFGFLAFLAASSHKGEVFNWLLAISGLAAIFAWFSINVAYIRFRRALAAQNRGTDELYFTSQVGVFGAYYGAALNVLCLAAQFWIAVSPLHGQPSAKNFFSEYLSAAVVLLFYFGHKLWTRNWSWYIPAQDIDIDTGRRELDLDMLRQELAEERAFIDSLPFHRRAYHFWC